MRPLILDAELRQNIRQLRDNATTNRWNSERVNAVIRGDAPPAGDEPQHVLTTEFGYRIVYSIEELPVFGWTHRLSVSVPAREKLPNGIVMQHLIRLFGPDDLQSVDYVDTERIETGAAILCCWLENRQSAKSFRVRGQLPAKDDLKRLLRERGWLLGPNNIVPQ